MTVSALAPAPDRRTDAVWRTPVRIYFQDTDAGGIVYHARYLDYFERARMDWLRAIDLAAGELEARHRVLFVVRSIGVDYLRPARLDDLLEATLRVDAVKGASLDLQQTVERDGAALVTARITLACVASGSLRAARLPSLFKERIRPAPMSPLPSSPSP